MKKNHLLLITFLFFSYFTNAQIKVLICEASMATYAADVQAKLQSTGMFSAVDVFDASLSTPTVIQLQAYDAVLVYSDNNFNDPLALGNNLAVYIDGGGGVVNAVFSNASIPLGGSFNTSPYLVIMPSAQTGYPVRTLGTVLLSSHPIMQSVSSFNGGSSSYRSTSTTITAGSYRVADYDNGELFIVANETAGASGTRRRADLNFYPPSSTARGDFWDAATSGTVIMANALQWVAGSRLTCNSLSVVNCAGSSISVPFTAINFNTGNVFTAQLSDAAGNFASPVNIGTLTTVTSSTINAAIPANSPFGTGYRIRVVGSNPVLTSNDNGTNIVINAQIAFSQSPSVCSGQSVTVGSNIYTTTNTYIDTLTSLVTGCDSLITTNLTVLPSNLFTQLPTLCAGQSITVGSHIYTTSNTYTDVLTSLVNDCDSTVTTHLTVLPANTFSQTINICAGESLIVGSSNYTGTGTYTDILIANNGCDSTVTTNLIVLPANTFTQTFTKCAGENVTVGNNIYTTSNTYIDTVTSIVSGCDSIVTTNLTVLPANTFTQSPVVCAGHSITVGGATHSANGNYTDVLTSLITGCDSTVTTNLTVIVTINTTTNVSGVSITANQTGAVYKWLNCNTGYSIIAGAANQTYTATVNGTYAVLVKIGNCSDTSACVSISNVGINESDLKPQFVIFPNPFTSQTTISFSEEQKNTTIKILDVLGKEVKTIDFTGKQLTIEKAEMNSGIYFVQIKNGLNNMVIKKIVVQ